MVYLPDDNVRQDAARRVRAGLAVPGLARALAVYFDPDAGFAGLDFSLLGNNPPDVVTADDLLAVSFLNIVWRPTAVRHLLGAGAEKISGMLAAIGTDVDLGEASEAELATVDPLWDALVDMPGVGTATASALLARKRPRLCPASEKAVIRAVGVPGQTWETLRCLLRDPDARAEIETLRPATAADVSLLRLLGAALWIRHSRSRAAQHVRLEAGMPAPPDPDRAGQAIPGAGSGAG